jgi:hypothetical protein
MSYVSYQLSQAGRQLTPSEQITADAQIGQLFASLSNGVRRLRGHSLVEGRGNGHLRTSHECSPRPRLTSSAAPR